MNLRTHPAARDELLNAARWYGERRPGLEEALLTEATRQVELIQAFPEACQRVGILNDGTPLRRATMSQFPFAVIFGFEQQVVFIVAFAHTSRRPAYWEDRRVNDARAEIAERYRQAYADSVGLGDELEGWEEQGEWPPE